MSEHPEATTPERARIEPSATTHKLDALPILYLLGFIILAASLVYVWRHPGGGGAEVREAQRVDTLRQDAEARRRELTELSAKVAALEARPVPAAPDLAPIIAPLAARLTALENRAGPDLRPLEGKVAALEARPPVDLGPLEARIAALEARKPVDLGPLEQKLDQKTAELGDRIGALDSATTGKLGALDRRIAALDGRIGALDGRVGALDAATKANAANLAGIAQRAQLARRVASAATALESGQRLGDIPGAPPAIARFAHDNPPTESSLRLSFDAAADAAHRASQPAITDDKPFLDRMWTRAQQSVTVRQGDRVLVGDPVAGVLASARQALDAGDLAGAVKVLNGGLAGPAKAAMADWIGRAQSLLDARAALAEMAAG